MTDIRGFVMEIMQTGKIDPGLEGIALFHAMGKSVDEESLSKFYTISGKDPSSTELENIKMITNAFRQFGFSEITQDVFFMPPKTGYKNPLLMALGKYDVETLKTAANQYGILVMLTMVATMYAQFKQTITEIEKTIGPGTRGEEKMKPGAVELLQKIGKREMYDPYLHAAFACVGFGRASTPENVAGILKSFQIEPDMTRLNVVCALINKTNLPELIKTQLMYVKTKGD